MFPFEISSHYSWAPTLSQYFFSFHYLSPSSFSNTSLLLPFNNPVICSRFDLFKEHKPTPQHPVSCAFPSQCFIPSAEDGAEGLCRAWAAMPLSPDSQPQPALPGLTVLHLANVFCSLAQRVVQGYRSMCKSLIAVSYLKWVYHPHSNLGSRGTVQLGMKSTFSFHAFCSKAGRWQCILRN